MKPCFTWVSRKPQFELANRKFRFEITTGSIYLHKPIGNLDLEQLTGRLDSYEPIGTLVLSKLTGSLDLKQPIGNHRLQTTLMSDNIFRLRTIHSVMNKLNHRTRDDQARLYSLCLHYS